MYIDDIFSALVHDPFQNDEACRRNVADYEIRMGHLGTVQDKASASVDSSKEASAKGGEEAHLDCSNQGK